MTDLPKAMTAFIPQLRRYGWSLTNDRQKADDLVQDCLLRAIQRQEMFREGTNLRAWLFTIMHNVFIDQIRRSSAAKTVASLDYEDCSIPEAPNQQGRLELAELQRAVDALPLEQKTTVLLVGLEGLSYEETAGVTGVAVGTVKSRLSRAREALRTMMAAADGEQVGEASAREDRPGGTERLLRRVS